MRANTLRCRTNHGRAARVRAPLLLAAGAFLSGCLATTAAAAVYHVTPSNYAAHLARLKPGDTLDLAGGTYPGLSIQGVHGGPSAWIVITGPVSGFPAVIAGSACCNAVEISDSSFVSIENLMIDSKNIEGVFGVSAKGGLNNLTHDIRIQDNRFIRQGASQQTVAISTKTPTWGWIIRRNRISGAGTGIYLGNSDGTFPFVGGLIENNLIEDAIGYDLEIKGQRRRPTVAGMPDGESATIIRHNVFLKNGRPSPDGDRPNVLLGGFPESGPGSTDRYEVYGNVFTGNTRESLLQASGRVSVHDNIFAGGDAAAVAFQAPLHVARVYSNTIYTEASGIFFGAPATADDAVTGNLIFAAAPLVGPVRHAANNTTDTPAHAAAYVNSPAFEIGRMDFYPLAGKCQGKPLDLTAFAADTDYALDFNGAPKEEANHQIAFRGAYAGAGNNPGWKLQVGIQGVAAAIEPAAAIQVSASAARPGETGSFLVLLRVPKGVEIAALQWEMSAGPGITIDPRDIVAGSAAAEGEKTISCALDRNRPGGAASQKCLLAGGRKNIPPGPVAIVRYRVDRKAHAGTTAVHIDHVMAVAADLRKMDLGRADGVLTIR